VFSSFLPYPLFIFLKGRIMKVKDFFERVDPEIAYVFEKIGELRAKQKSMFAGRTEEIANYTINFGESFWIVRAKHLQLVVNCEGDEVVTVEVKLAPEAYLLVVGKGAVTK